MSDSWISYVGLRVTNLERSLGFYTQLFDLEEITRGESDDSKWVLLRDRRSGQRLELYWYSPESPSATPYLAGHGLDHIGVRVRDAREMQERLKKLGIEPSTSGLPPGVDLFVTPRFRLFHVKDPDGNLLELYDHPDEDWDGPIPSHF
jgi:catechol 2,3-dioxygenase-like lactoylglutathione lyase family enzyme